MTSWRFGKIFVRYHLRFAHAQLGDVDGLFNGTILVEKYILNWTISF
jgi:hypothetical protein